MKAGPKPKPAADSPKTAALREAAQAIADGDIDGAAAALGVAVQSCMDEYENEPEE